MEGIERFGGNVSEYEELLTKFPADTSFTSMCDAISSGDVKVAFAAAHTLKGISGHLSMNRLYTDLYPLAEELRSGNLKNAEALLLPVKLDYDNILAALK